MIELRTICGQVSVIREEGDPPKCARCTSVESDKDRFGMRQYRCGDCGEPLTSEQVAQIVREVFP